MADIHALDTLPSQEAINSIATYRLEFDKNTFNYKQLLTKLQKKLAEINFVNPQDNADWMRKRGGDYLSNPTLFCHAPLTYLCAFLSEIFKQYDLPELQEKLTPSILKSALTRLAEFRLY